MTWRSRVRALETASCRNGSDFSNRRLEGKIPDRIGDLKFLKTLYLNGNKLRGSIPESFKNLKSLSEFNLCDNSLEGPVPPFIGQMTSLKNIYLCKNFFNETIPPELGSLPSLEYLDLGNNNLSGKIPDELGNIKSLIGLYLSDNQLSDVLPVQLGNLVNLEELDLSFNSLFGEIPEAVSNSLNYIFLRKNKLNGIIPAWMNASPYVDVSENSFLKVNISPGQKLNPNMNLFACCSDEKDEVAKRDQVDFDCKNGTLSYDRLFINCGGESVSVNGSVYEADVHPRGESTFFKSNRSNWGYSSMGNFLWARRNKYTLNQTCQIKAGDAQLYRTARSSPISLKYYGFCLRTGRYHVKLHFAEISSSDTKRSHSKAGRLFDVLIQGENVLKNFSIETEAKDVNTAVTTEHEAYVNNSRLEIHLYWSGKGSVLYPSQYYGPLISAITITPVQSELRGGVLAGISGFALLLLILFIVFSWKFEDKLRREELELVELYPGGLYNYRKIKAATENFAIANRLGEEDFGTVYKGTLSNGTTVAVKKLSETKEGMLEFVENSRAIVGMKHPNLVTLMGSCAGKNQLLLVYEYIGTNTLEDALFGSDEFRARLDGPTRYRICLGIAEGLAFLHEWPKQKIIHGDIKPENILLDYDLNPKIYAKLYHKQKPEGTMYYTAPEVKDRPLEASADVYSFGVVMLIIVSGMKIKTPRSGADNEYLVDEAQKKDRKGRLLDLIDPKLMYVWDDAPMILRLAMQCMDVLPTSRPTMSTVVKILKKEHSIETILIKSEGD